MVLKSSDQAASKSYEINSSSMRGVRSVGPVRLHVREGLSPGSIREKRSVFTVTVDGQMTD